MAPGSPVVALLSIKPAYVKEILAGRKKVEFRKRSFKRAVTHVVIYSTAPVQRVVGWFQTNRFEKMSPAALWKKFRTMGGITETAFNDYYGDSLSGVAIHVTAPRRLKRPLTLAKIHANTPPQSYAYLPASVLSKLGGPKLGAPKRLVAKRKRAILAKPLRGKGAPKPSLTNRD